MLQHPEKLEAATRALWVCYWSNGQVPSAENISKALENIMDPSFITSINAIVGDSTIKEILQETTQEALNLGSFGVPWIKVEFNGNTEVFRS